MNAYIYKSDLHCEFCGAKLSLNGKEHYLKGPYPNGGGESDSPQHCGTCGLFLENPLTEDGEMYVQSAYDDLTGVLLVEKSRLETINQWVTFYEYLDLANIGEGPY